MEKSLQSQFNSGKLRLLSVGKKMGTYPKECFPSIFINYLESAMTAGITNCYDTKLIRMVKTMWRALKEFLNTMAMGIKIADLTSNKCKKIHICAKNSN